jgi:hypothetical protein
MLNKPVDEIIYDESGHVTGVKSEGAFYFVYFILFYFIVFFLLFLFFYFFIFIYFFY